MDVNHVDCWFILFRYLTNLLVLPSPSTEIWNGINVQPVGGAGPCPLLALLDIRHQSYTIYSHTNADIYPVGNSFLCHIGAVYRRL